MKEKLKENKKKEKPVKKKLVPTRGRVFKGEVIRKFPGRITIEFERTIKVHKYERFLKKKTRIHAHLPEHIDADEGDIVKIQECRPLSKTIHFMVIEIIQKAEELGEGSE